MGKASRQRRLKQERERKQRRAAQPSASSPSGSSRPPHETQRHDIPPRQGRGTRRDIRHEPPSQAKQASQRELAAVGVAEALHALAHGMQDQFMEWVEALAGQRQVPGWDATVSRELVSYLRVSVSGAWRHGWQPPTRRRCTVTVRSPPNRPERTAHPTGETAVPTHTCPSHDVAFDTGLLTVGSALPLSGLAIHQ